MKNKSIKALELKEQLQEQVAKKFARLSLQEQLELLRREFGHLTHNQTARKSARHTPVISGTPRQA